MVVFQVVATLFLFVFVLTALFSQVFPLFIRRITWFLVGILLLWLAWSGVSPVLNTFIAICCFVYAFSRGMLQSFAPLKNDFILDLTRRWMGRISLLNIWVIGTAVFGSISLWNVGMLSGGIGFDIASIGGHGALLFGGAILGAGVGLLFFPIVKIVSSALSGDRWALLGLGISAIASIFCALQGWRGSGGNLFITILGALVGLLIPFYIYSYVTQRNYFQED